MSNWWLFLFAVIPPVFFVFYIYKRDSKRPEPKGSIFRVFLLGVLSCIVVLLVGIPFLSFSTFLEENPLGYAIFKAFILAGFIEEGVKFLLIRKYVYKKPYFDEVMDGIVFTVVAGMGFACIENIGYVMNGGIGVAISRAVHSVPLHAAASAIMGFYIGLAKFTQDAALRRRYLWKGFLLAWMLHGLYDVFLFLVEAGFSHIFFLGIYPVLIFGLRNARTKIKLALKVDEERNIPVSNPIW